MVRCRTWFQDHLSWDRWEVDHRGLLPGPAARDPKLAHVATAGSHDHQQHCPGVHAPPLKRNPLYRADAASGGATAPHAAVDALSPLARVPPRSQAAWTLEEFSRRAVAPGARPTPAMQRALRASQPERLEFWLEDVTTPGYEALLRRKEQQERRWRSLRCAALTLATLAALALLAGLAAVAVKFWVKL
ncbi:major intrinsically disordered NOTCH2-binding receptor 1-like [Lampetra planeri]